MKTILLAEPDIDLKENIIELLQLESYSVIDLLKVEGDNIKKFIDKQAISLINAIVLRKNTHINKVITKLIAKQIPIVIFSPDPDDTTLMKSSKWMPLPFEPEELLKMVESG